MKKILTILIAVLFGSNLLAAGKLKKITLKDGSAIISRVIEMKDGQYTVETDTLGTLKLHEDKIIEILSLEPYEKSYINSHSSSSSKIQQDIQIQDGTRRKNKRKNNSSVRQQYKESLQPSDSSDINTQQEEVNSWVKSMTANSDFLESLLNLSENKSLIEVMSDPEIMDAISSNDYNFLMNNEKIKNLMESPEIKDLLRTIEP